MKYNFAVSVLFATALTLGAVLAHAAVPAELTKTYEAGVAGKICKPAPDSAKSSKLGDAVQRAEQKSGLAQADLDAAWTAVETAAKHFAGQSDLVLVSVDAAKLGDQLKWEPSRGGALFPHLYGDLDLAAVIKVVPLPLGAGGSHEFPPFDP